MTTAQQDDEEQTSVEYKRPDAQKAIEIYDRQIKPKLTQIATLKGDLSDPWGDLKEHAHISKKDFNYVQGLVDEEDDAKRDHRLLSLAELLKARGLFMPRDLVSMANGDEGGSIVQAEDRPRPRLVGVDDDDEDEKDDFEEASEEELAGQKPRAEEAEKKSLKKPSFQMDEAPLDAA